MSNKILHIMRGLPGSGKSYKAKQLGEGGKVFSTDEYFIKDGDYCFDISKLGCAHKWNQDRSINAIERGITPIVIDNTNVRAWESRPYVEAALRCNYSVKIELPITSWAYDIDELAKRNGHGVSKEVIKRMLSNFKRDLSIEEILNSSYEDFDLDR